MSSNPYQPPAADADTEKSKLIRSELLRTILAGFVSSSLILAVFFSHFVTPFLQWIDSTRGVVAGVIWLYLQVWWVIYPTVHNLSDFRRQFLQALIGIPALLIGSAVAFGYASIIVILMMVEL